MFNFRNYPKITNIYIGSKIKLLEINFYNMRNLINCDIPFNNLVYMNSAF
jgi:hypothetical protein